MVLASSLGVLFVSVISIIGGSALLFLRQKSKLRDSDPLNALLGVAIGSLLATSFLDLIPEALHEAEQFLIPADRLFQVVLFGFLSFFLLERCVLWFHHHHDTHGMHPTALLLTLGDSIHNALDGVAIGAAFAVGLPTGIATTLAVTLHEIPQEMGDFAILLGLGVSSFKTILFNIVSAAAAFAGLALFFVFAGRLAITIPYVLAFTAGMFLYIGGSDLLPTLHRKMSPSQSFQQVFYLLLGVISMTMLRGILE